MGASRNTREWMREYMRQYRAAGRDPRRAAVTRKPFVAVDGEGWNLDNGYHAYTLLSIGEQSITPADNAVRLTTEECLAFIADQSPENIYVAYFFDYDVTKICEDLGWTKLARLMDRSSRTRDDGQGLWPIDYRGFQIDYLPRKEFKVRRKIREFTYCGLCDDGSHYGDDSCSHPRPKPEFSPWVVVNDVGSFFQTSFVSTLDKWKIGTDTERKSIESGKDKRRSFSIDDFDEILAYNLLENRLLSETMERFRAACQETGYIPKRWQGPGLLAECMLASHGVPKSKDVPLLNDRRYDGLLEFARAAFYGGRPELAAVGHVRQEVIQADINSAYPYAMQFVPCLHHGSWELIAGAYGNVDRPTGKIGERYGISYGSFTDPLIDKPNPKKKRPLWYGLPIRTDDGSIVYPGNGRGWYWTFEIGASIHQRFVPEFTWIYTRTCECEPLGFVRDVYERRLAMGKDYAGYVLKLALNSIFGKTVQSIGIPKYSNPIWGSFITAMCRTQIQDFIHSSPHCQDGGWCGADILMVATDSVATITDRRDIEPNQELGGWSFERHPDGMLLIQPGVYFGSSKDKDGQTKKAKTRGVPRTAFEEREQDFRRGYERMAESRDLRDGDVRVNQTLFCGIRYALHRHNLKLLGQWIPFKDKDTGEEGKVIRFDWTTKRARVPALAPIPGIRDWIQTFPKDGSTDIQTLPYSKNIGGLMDRDEHRLAFADQPDWVTPWDLTKD